MYQERYDKDKTKANEQKYINLAEPSLLLS